MTISTHSMCKIKGFTLMEMAVVMVIVGLLLGGLLAPFSLQLEQRAYSQTNESLDDAKETLIGFALVNKRLPCPDTDGDAAENTTLAFVDDTPIVGQSTETTSCAAPEGWLPTQNLQIPDRDFWAKRFRYRVAPSFSNYVTVYNANGGSAGVGTVVSSTYFTLASTGDITIQTRGDDPGTAGVQGKFPLNMVTNVPAIIISHGVNGFGSSSSQSVAVIAPPASNVDETTNSTSQTTKISRPIVKQQSDCSDTDETKGFCEFDDSLTWVPSSILLNRMVVAGKLP